LTRVNSLVRLLTETCRAEADDEAKEAENPMKPTTTWILIADGARARIFANDGPGKGIELVEGATFDADHRPDREIASDKPGRTFESVGATRHAIQPHHDPHRELKRAFSERLAAMLDEKLAAKAFDRVVLVAPPVTLGDLRSALSAHVKAAVYAELDKDLTKTPAHELPQHLAAVMAV
jgi:protein required for attachment to host cells